MGERESGSAGEPESRRAGEREKGRSRTLPPSHIRTRPLVPAASPLLARSLALPLSGWLSLTSALWAITFAALFVQFVVYLAHAAAVLSYPFDLDQGEGYDLNAGWLLAQGRSIYTDNEGYPYFSSNYPPLYSAVLVGAISVWGPTLLAGRAISLAATLGLAALVFLAARSRGGTVGGLVASGVFWLSNYVYHVTPLARVNALTAFLAFGAILCAERQGRGWYALTIGLLLAALFTKPTALDATAAVLVFWYARRPSVSLVGAAVLGVLGLVLAGGLELSTGGAFSLNVLRGNVNPFIFAQLRDYLVNFGLLHAVPLGLAALGVLLAWRSRVPGPLEIYLLTGLVAGLGVGKWGAGESYFLSAIVAAAALAGTTAGRLLERGGLGARVLPLLLLAQCAISAHGAVSTAVPFLPDRGLQAAALAAEPTYAALERGHAIVTRLREQVGPGLVEDPGFSIAAGKEVVGNATHLRNLHEAGLWRPDALVADLASRRYHSVILDAELYPEPVLAAIGRYYFLYDSLDVYRATQKVFLPGAS